MAKGINKVILIGNLGVDPEIRYMPSGGAVATLSLATTDSWKDKSGQLQEKTEWHRVVLFNRLGEIAGEYLKKGSKIYIEGSIRTNKWQDNQGQDRYTTEIVANTMQMLDGRGSNSNITDGNANFQERGNSSNSNAANNNAEAVGSNMSSSINNKAEILDDEIPF